MIINLGNNAGVYVTPLELALYRKIKFNKQLSASVLSESDLTVARQLVNKSIISRKKIDGQLYYIISSHVSNN